MPVDPVAVAGFVTPVAIVALLLVVSVVVACPAPSAPLLSLKLGLPW